MMIRTSRIIKKAIISICVFLILSLIFSFSVFADSYSLYRSTSPSDSVTSSLIGLYRNKDTFNPYDEYLVCRTGDYDYYLFYAPSLSSGSYSYIRYYGVASGYNTQWNYSEGTGSNLSIYYGSYKPVGNVSESISSSVFEEFKFQYVVAVLLILLTVFLGFKCFRVVIRTRRNGGWNYG